MTAAEQLIESFLDEAKLLTPSQEQEAIRAISTTWDVIASDALQLVGPKGMPASHAIEFVLDANYIDMYGRIKDPVVKSLFNEYSPANYKYKKRLAAKVIRGRQY